MTMSDFYLITLLVTSEQESAIVDLYTQRCWVYMKLNAGSEQLLRIKCEDLKNTTGNELGEPTDLNSKRKHISSKAQTADDYIPPRIVATAYLNMGTARDAKTDTSAVINESSVTGPDKEHAIEMGTFTVRQFTAIESETSNSTAVRESITEPVRLKKSTVVFDSNENYAEYCSALQQSNPLTAPKLYNSTSRSETKQSAMPNVEKGKKNCIKGSMPLGKTDTKMFPEPASELKTEKSAEEKAVVHTLTQVKVNGKRKENNEGFFCDICNWTFKRKITYDNHLLNDKCILRCGMCPKVFPYRNKSTFKTHLRVHNKQFDYKCEGCGSQFVGKYNFLRHQQTFHNKDKPHNCDICFKTFPSESDLILHKSTNHSVEGKYPCPQCTKVFQQPLPLRENLKFKHLIGEDRLLACSFCGKFCNARYLPLHEKLQHKKTKDFKCDRCPAVFVTASMLREHMRRHTKSYREFCEICGKGFYMRNLLTQHLRTHTGEKPFACNLYDYRCAARANLTKHLKVHNKLD